jgi:GT2 family glycosyltransferase
LRVKVSIITVNYNGYDDTCALIESIPLNDKSLEVIVVDNASRINEAEKISAKYPLVKTIRSEQNLGFAGGNNLGIKEASGDYLFFINNDTYLKDFNISALIDRLNSSDEIGMVCPKIRFAWENNPIQFAGYTPLSRITLRNKAIGYNEQDKGHFSFHRTNLWQCCRRGFRKILTPWTSRFPPSGSRQKYRYFCLPKHDTPVYGVCSQSLSAPVPGLCTSTSRGVRRE